MEAIILERHGLQVGPDSTDSHLSGVGSSLAAAQERLEPHCGCLPAGHLLLELLLVCLVSGIIDKVTRLVREEVSANRTRLIDKVASSSDSLQLDS